MFSRLISRSQPAANRVRQFASQVTPPPPTPSGGGGGGGGLSKGWIGIGLAGAAAAAYYYSTMPDAPASGLTQSGSSATSPLSPDEFRPFTLKEVTPITHNTARFRFALPHSDQTLGMPTASFVLTAYSPKEGDPPVVRPYTPTSQETDRGYFDLVVKEYEQGKMSRHIHSLKPGDQLKVKGPITKYPLQPNQHAEVGLIAGGTGITPMLQIAHKILNNPQDRTVVKLVFGNVSEDDILLKDTLDQWAIAFPDRFKVHYVVDQAKNPKQWKAQNGSVGFVTQEVVKAHLPSPSQANVKLFVCGPPPMMKAISGDKAPDYSQGELSGLLKSMGYSKDQVFKF